MVYVTMPDDYTEFYTAYKSKLYKYLIYKSGDPDLAQEIVQESFARHFQHYGQQAAGSPALLFTIARNTLVDAQRYRNKHRPLSLYTVPSQVEPIQEATVVGREQMEKVVAAIEKLQKRDRQMLKLAVTGVPYQEIATTHEVSIANVKIRIHRARKRLQKLLTEEE